MHDAYTPPPAAELVARRAKLFVAIGEACALVQGAGPVERSEAFRQTNEFYYLCGIEVPRAHLWLDGRRHATTLFLPRRDARQERSEGPMLAAEDDSMVRMSYGVDEVRPVEDLFDYVAAANTIYTPHSPHEGVAMYRDELLHTARQIAADPWHSRLSHEARLVGLLRGFNEQAEIRDLSPILDELRLIKSSYEISLMRRCGELTALSVIEAMRSTRAGLTEYQLGAVMRYIAEINGAQGDGYRPIIASGANIWFTHYYRNNAVLTDGDVVLLDYAPDYHYYTSDIGRTWPVNGRFSAQQRELYGFITRYHKALLQRIRPGVRPQQILDEAATEMRAVIAATSFSKPIYEQAARATLEFAGHLSHPVGMAVHDVGNYRERDLEPGLVFSVDPQMWVPEEQLYIRVEDTVVVTAAGMENLTCLAPIELDAIEAMVGQKGLLQQFPPHRPLEEK